MRKQVVPLEQDEQMAFVRWCQLNQIRGHDWREAKIGLPGYLINEYGDMVTTKLKKEPFHLLKRQKYAEGYQYYSISKGNRKCLKVKVHRAIALTFLPNPHGYSFVNHINGIKNDNRLENLEWVTASENNLHAYRVLGHKSSGGVARKRVICVETGVVYDSVREAARSLGPGTSNTSISGAAKGRMVYSNGEKYRINTCGGFHWRFV